MTTSEAFARLNRAQREAATFGETLPGHGVRAAPLLVIAGAGTGKTSTLAHRVAHLLLEGVAPERLLLLTFSRRAAVEMTRRGQQVVAEALQRANAAAAKGANTTAGSTSSRWGMRVFLEQKTDRINGSGMTNGLTDPPGSVRLGGAAAGVENRSVRSHLIRARRDGAEG